MRQLQSVHSIPIAALEHLAPYPPLPQKNVHVMTAFTPELCAHAVLKMCAVQTVGV